MARIKRNGYTFRENYFYFASIFFLLKMDPFFRKGSACKKAQREQKSQKLKSCINGDKSATVKLNDSNADGLFTMANSNLFLKIYIFREISLVYHENMLCVQTSMIPKIFESLKFKCIYIQSP